MIRGEQDEALGADAAARVKRFRRLRSEWLDVMQTATLRSFRAPSLARCPSTRRRAGFGARPARNRRCGRLLDRLRGFLREKPDATTAEVLEYAQQRTESDLETCEPPVTADGFVQMTSVEAALGREFEHAIVANVRPVPFRSGTHRTRFSLAQDSE